MNVGGDAVLNSNGTGELYNPLSDPMSPPKSDMDSHEHNLRNTKTTSHKLCKHGLKHRTKAQKRLLQEYERRN